MGGKVAGKVASKLRNDSSKGAGSERSANALCNCRSNDSLHAGRKQCQPHFHQIGDSSRRKTQSILLIVSEWKLFVREEICGGRRNAFLVHCVLLIALEGTGVVTYSSWSRNILLRIKKKNCPWSTFQLVSLIHILNFELFCKNRMTPNEKTFLFGWNFLSQLEIVKSCRCCNSTIKKIQYVQRGSHRMILITF
jgi:hypothetical protein